MSDIATDSKLNELDRRVQALESKVAALPDSWPPPVDPTQAPSLKDIALPIPNVESIVTTARTTWALYEIFGEMKTFLWMLVDRRYHMGWLTRLLTIGLVVFILMSHFVWPFARVDMILSPIWDKLVDLVLGLALFMILHFEMRRYKEWRSKR